MMKKLYPFILFILLFSCRQQPAKVAPPAVAVNKFADQTLITIYNLQDERRTPELLTFLHHENPLYRREAALAFASVQSAQAVAPLLQMLQDPQPEVRQAAAYALGQTGEPSAEQKLHEAARKEKDPAALAEMLEASGKVATQTGLDFLVNYQAPNQIAKAGQARGLYRAGQRKLQYETAVPVAVQLLNKNNSYETRLAAAHFLARTPQLKLIAYNDSLIQASLHDAAAEVRMAVTTTLGKLKTEPAAKALAQLLKQETDYRVRISAVRALGAFPYPLVKEHLWPALADPNEHVAVATAEVLLNQASEEKPEPYEQHATKAENWRVAATLWAGAIKAAKNSEQLREQVQERYRKSTHVYEKAALLRALGQDYRGYSFVEEQTFSILPATVTTAGIEALAEMRRSKGFPIALEQHFARIFRRAITSGDVALIGTAATVLREPELHFKKAYADFSFLNKALNRISLPKDVETHQELLKTIAFFTGEEAPAAATPFTHPIDWSFVPTIPAQQRVLVSTSKGDVTFQLFTEEAPATVANFMELVKKGFYNGKSFHRVVPNFVAQGGCPRGDGWGSTDYTIRSEFANLRYGEGYVGMASAGKDTESCQWFITHSPAPHLDGRYTIFAKVVDGMHLVHQLQIGDQILSVRLLD